ncbi:MAG TPA: O-antigen ligase family protein [Brumimicrobium sp.]|nr:O-antigen ligase family protein [Brumimicrobium sp.]
MEQLLKRNYLIISLVLVFIGINAYFIFDDNYYLNALPLALIIAYIGVFYTKTAFLMVAFFTPLSINLEEFTHGEIGLYLPTEPILFGLMLWIILKELKSPVIHPSVWKHPITISLGFYLFWLFITSITSTSPLISFKFLLMKSWFIIPLLMIGTIVFLKKDNIIKFLWSYGVGMSFVMIYTLVRHAGYDFGDREGHWVMEPIFKDHTIYGAAVAMNLFFVFGLLIYKKHALHTQIILGFMFVLTLVALYFSYTRGAWLSVIFAGGVWFLIRYKIKFKYVVSIAGVIGAIVFASWTQIEMRLAKNKHEHTTTNFEERMASSTNITTDTSNLERLNRWHAAFGMFKEKPVFGFGPGTYTFEYAPYQDPNKLTIISTNFGTGGNAHSEYLGPLAETGFIGMLSVLAFVTTLFYAGITLLIHIKRYSPEEKQLYILMLCIVLAMSTYFFHGIINNYLDSDKAAVPVYGAAAMIIAQQIRLREKRKSKHYRSV